MEYSENELISELKKQNPHAFETLIQVYTKPVYYLAYSILRSGSKEDVEECVSDVFLDVWKKIKAFDCERGTFKTWIFMLTKYRALAYRRSGEKRVIEPIEADQIPDPQDVEKQVVDRQTQERLVEIINSFGKVDKELFMRRYFCDESIGDLMTAFGLSRSAIDNRLFRGRKIIKEVLSYE